MPSVGEQLYRPETEEGYQSLDKLLVSYKETSFNQWMDAMRWLALNDLYFLCTRIGLAGNVVNKKSGIPIFRKKFFLDRTRDIEESEHDIPDVWWRGAGKSYAKTRMRNIQYALNDPNSASIIFSYQKDASIAHLSGIDQELSNNKLLISLFIDDMLWENPRADTKKAGLPWTATGGQLCLRRSDSSRIEYTFEAGYLKRVKTGKHFDRIYWDDVEDDQAVETVESIKKLHHNFRQSGNIKTLTGTFVRSFTGTIYHSGGIVARQIKKKGDRARVFPGEINLETGGPGPLGGYPADGITLDELWDLWEELDGAKDPAVYAMQIACTYKYTKSLQIKLEWFRRYLQDPIEAGRKCFIYPCVDPSKADKEAQYQGDRACIFVWGTTSDRRKLWLDADNRRMSPDELYKAVYLMVLKWQRIGIDIPHIRVEEYGQSNWVNPIEGYLNRRGIYIPVIGCADYKTKGKINRIFNRWQPPLKAHEILVPRAIIGINDDGDSYDIVDYFFMNEVAEWPKPLTDNVWDAGSLLFDEHKKLEDYEIDYPMEGEDRRNSPDNEEYHDEEYEETEGTFMSISPY